MLTRCGQTAARLTLTEVRDGADTRVHALAAFLSGLNEQDDYAVVDAVRDAEVLRSIDPADFEKPLAGPRPFAAVYFTCQASLDAPVLYDVIKAAHAAFLDQLGIVSTR